MSVNSSQTLARTCARVLSNNVPLRTASSLHISTRAARLAATTANYRGSSYLRLVRPFSSSSTRYKKRKPSADSNNASAQSSSSNSSPSSSSSSQSQPDPENPLDFSALIAAYAPIDSHFKSQLQALLHGGRFNPSHLGSLPVPIKSTSSSTGDLETYPLRELAQVVPRPGRTISLLVNERDYIKPIMSAVQSSKDFNQQPQRSEDNDLELILKVELERRDEVVRRAKEACQGWRERVRQARTKHEKVLKDGKKKGTVLPDVLKKADKELQKVQDQKMKEIDQEEAQTVRQLERNST